jgi:hypothetical protein
MTCAVVGHAGRSRWGEGDSPGGSHRPLAVASCRHRAVYEQKNSGPAAALRGNRESSYRGPEQRFYNTPLFSRTVHSAASSRPSGLRRQDTRLGPHGLTSLPGFLSDLPAGFFSPILHSFEGPETCPAGAAGSGEAAIAPRSGDEQDPASSGQDRPGGDYRLRRKRGQRPERVRSGFLCSVGHPVSPWTCGQPSGTTRRLLIEAVARADPVVAVSDPQRVSRTSSTGDSFLPSLTSSRSAETSESSGPSSGSPRPAECPWRRSAAGFALLRVAWPAWLPQPARSAKKDRTQRPESPALLVHLSGHRGGQPKTLTLLASARCLVRFPKF